jgi:hypothetical protein
LPHGAPKSPLDAAQMQHPAKPSTEATADAPIATLPEEGAQKGAMAEGFEKLAGEQKQAQSQAEEINLRLQNERMKKR